MNPVSEGKGKINWESSIETQTLPYVKQRVSGNLLYEEGNSNPMLCDNRGMGQLEGGLGEQGHTHAYG